LHNRAGPIPAGRRANGVLSGDGDRGLRDEEKARVVVMRLLISMSVLATLVFQESSPISIIDATRFYAMGQDYKNMLSETERRTLETRVRGLQDGKSAITFREFLGGHIKNISVISVSEPNDGFAKAQALLSELMESLLVQPHSEGPFLSQVWSELTVVSVVATIHYDDGRVGALETDGWHLFVEDHQGIYWWYRWDRNFPRRHR